MGAVVLLVPFAWGQQLLEGLIVWDRPVQELSAVGQIAVLLMESLMQVFVVLQQAFECQMLEFPLGVLLVPFRVAASGPEVLELGRLELEVDQDHRLMLQEEYIFRLIF